MVRSFNRLRGARWRRRFALLSGLLVLSGAVGSDCGGPTVDEPVFPADYRNTYTLVRDCRLGIEHGGTQIRVWVNDIGAAAYQAEEDPLPVGTVVVKEEYEGTDCSNDDDLHVWAVMRKESPGFDPDNNDWDWIEYAAPGRTRTSFVKQLCIDCHRDPDCVARDYMCTEAP